MHSYLNGRVLVDCADTAVAEPLVRALATTLTGRDPGALHHHCPFCGSIEHGRPYVDGPLHVSVAHSSGLTAVAVSEAGPVGIDLEADAELEWLRREAAGKAMGVGIAGESDAEPVWQSEVPIPGLVALVALVNPQEAQEAQAAAARSATRRTTH